MTSSPVTLETAKRDVKTTLARDLLAERRIPAEYYGAGVENISLSMDYQTFRRLFREHGESTVIDLVIEGESAPKKVLVHNVQFHPVSDEFMHVDFINVDMSKPVTTHVPVVLTGESPAVKIGGVLMHAKSEISVKCLPADLPHELTADISSLAEFHSSLTVADLVVDRAKVELLDAEDVVIVSIAAPKTQEQVDAEEAAEAEAIAAAVPDDVKAEADEEKAAAEESKASDTGGKGDK